MLQETDVLDTLTHNAVKVMPELQPADLVTDTSLADLGCNSIDRADIVSMTMDELGVVVPVTELYSGQRIGELVELFVKYS